MVNLLNGKQKDAVILVKDKTVVQEIVARAKGGPRKACDSQQQCEETSLPNRIRAGYKCGPAEKADELCTLW